jgi:hypothetical protein
VGGGGLEFGDHFADQFLKPLEGQVLLAWGADSENADVRPALQFAGAKEVGGQPPHALEVIV